MQVTFTKTIDKCVDCPFHKILPDPDPDDWFCDDDEMLCCTHENFPKDKQPEYYQKNPRQYSVINGALRPYETPKHNIPDYCPLAGLK